MVKAASIEKLDRSQLADNEGHQAGRCSTSAFKKSARLL
jgi:hypothetical protein